MTYYEQVWYEPSMNNIGANRADSTAKNEKEEAPAVATDQLSTEDMWRQKVCVKQQNLRQGISIAH